MLFGINTKDSVPPSSQDEDSDVLPKAKPGKIIDQMTQITLLLDPDARMVYGDNAAASAATANITEEHTFSNFSTDR